MRAKEPDRDPREKIEHEAFEPTSYGLQVVDIDQVAMVNDLIIHRMCQFLACHEEEKTPSPFPRQKKKS